MENYLQGNIYSQILAEHSGQGLSEKEVNDLLLQVLPQLIQLHNQGKIHGAISLNCLLKQGNQVVLLPPATFSAQSGVSQDIFDLGLSVITLLTAKNTDSLRTNNRSWDWQDNCVISDRLADVLENAISSYPEHRYPNALAMQQALFGSNTAVIPPVIPANSNHSGVAFINTNSKNKLAGWQWIAIGTGCTFLIALAGFSIFSLANKPDNSEVATNQPVNNLESINSEDSIDAESNIEKSVDLILGESQTQKSQTSLRTPAPDKFIRDHYALLNNRAYQVTWDNLTPEFQNIAGGFSGYTQWWNSVRRIELGTVEIIEQSSDQAIVEAQISWVNSNGEVSLDSKSWVHLVWNDSINQWQINKKTKPSDFSSTPQLVSTPSIIATKRVQFSRGSSGAMLSDSLNENEAIRYLLNCGQGQLMKISIDQGNPDIKIISPNGQIIGQIIQDPNNLEEYWQERLPASGDFKIEVSNTNASTHLVQVEVLN
jgi:hypothetical protein